MRSLGWQAEKIPCQIFIKKLPLLGAVIKVPRPESVPFTALEQAAKKHRALFVKVEPDLQGPSPSVFLEHGFQPDSWPLCATAVVKINLEGGLSLTQSRFHKDARYSVRKAEHSGVTVETYPILDQSSENRQKIQTFYQLFRKTGAAKGFWVPSRREVEAKALAFAPHAFLILTKFGKEYLSGALILLHEKSASYEYAASSALGRKLLAQYLVVEEAVKLAMSSGCQILDLGGITDPRFRVSRRWQGLEVFKGKFGGEFVKYPGSYTKYYNPLVKLLFKLNF
jgi:lipid II:glycine glycyltransferase (peptidoglycan interpeptide bridge formation enzyme)